MIAAAPAFENIKNSFETKMPPIPFVQMLRQMSDLTQSDMAVSNQFGCENVMENMCHTPGVQHLTGQSVDRAVGQCADQTNRSKSESHSLL